jgi:phage tail sheath protein FI
MAFQLSPGVLVTEKDLTNVVPAVSSSAGGFVGYFLWGPVDEIQTVSSENQLVREFGKPTATTTISFHTAANFLGYGNNLQLVRTVGTAARNAVSTGTAVLIKNSDSYLASYAAGEGAVGAWAAKYAGALGNSLKVSVADSSTFTGWTYEAQFDAAPGVSSYVSGLGGANDELHIIVVDENGLFSGTAGTVLEKFAFVSKASDAKNSDGSTNYYKNVINTQSKYIWWMDHLTAGASSTGGNAHWGNAGTSTFALIDDISGGLSDTVSLAGGVDATPSDGDLEVGYDLFANKELVDVSLLLTSNHSAAVNQHVIDNVALARLDCVVFLSPPLAAVQNNAGDEATDIVTYRNSTLDRSTSYAVMDSGWKVQYDKYNDTYVNVPLNADTAGLCARTDQTNDPWWSPAGFNRGGIKNCVKLLYSPNQTDRDTLYKNGINPVVSFPGQGVVLYGDKTLLAKPSAFDRINVRRLFIVLEKAIATAAKFQLFEFNDVFTRAQFRSLVEPFLRDVRGRRGIYDFRVVCDETNNTGEVIDRNEFVADIYIKPAKSINFIYLNFIATRTSVSFEEVGA